MSSGRRDNEWGREVIGLLPAAGLAARIAPLPCSKEIYPIGFLPVDEGRSVRPKVVCHYLLEKMRTAGITKAYIVLREGKWDIPAYFGDGAPLDMHLAYLMMRVPYGPPYTLVQAYPFVKDALVAFGFPDIVFQPDDAFIHLLDRQAAANADVVLGLFPADRPETMDMVDMDDAGVVCSIVLKPLQTHLRYTWIIAVWTPVFTSFLHKYLTALQGGKEHNGGVDAPERQELSVGHVLQAALRDGLRVHAVPFPDHTYLDIGTPDNLVKAVYGARHIEDIHR